jgi:hypothetical protein
VRQGGVLSPHLYKTYIDGLIQLLEHQGDGVYIGSTFVGSPAVADDVMLLTESPLRLQFMLNTATRYSNRERYNIHPLKSATAQFSSSKLPSDFEWQLAGSSMGVSDSVTHLGITHCGAPVREHLHAEWIRDKVKTTRKTVYALMGTGLHGANGVDPLTGVRIYELYALPKLLYGMDVAETNKTQLSSLEDLHRGILRALQSLPNRVANAAVYLLAGSMPVEGFIHTRKLSLIGAIARMDNSTLAEICLRQCSLKDVDSASWFKDTELLLLKYGLPTSRALFQDPVPKDKWKAQVRKAVSGFWTTSLLHDAQAKTSLRWLNLQHVHVGVVHHCWWYVMPSVKDVRRAAVKVKMLTGTYPTQERLASWDSRGNVLPACPLCQSAVETLDHMLLWCPATHTSRCKELSTIAKAVQDRVGVCAWRIISSQDVYLMQLLLDSSHLVDAELLPVDSLLTELLELHSRRLCYTIHCRRAFLMEEILMKKKK